MDFFNRRLLPEFFLSFFFFFPRRITLRNCAECLNVFLRISYEAPLRISTPPGISIVLLLLAFSSWLVHLNFLLYIFLGFTQSFCKNFTGVPSVISRIVLPDITPDVSFAIPQAFLPRFLLEFNTRICGDYLKRYPERISKKNLGKIFGYN